jgi:hypothetical protein
MSNATRTLMSQLGLRGPRNAIAQPSNSENRGILHISYRVTIRFDGGLERPYVGPRNRASSFANWFALRV